MSALSEQTLQDERLDLVTDLAEALHRAGLPSHRLEAATMELARALDLDLQVLALPTALTVAAGTGASARVLLRRVDPADPDLARLSELDELARHLARRDIGLKVARARLEQVQRQGPQWSAWSDLAAWAASSGAAAVLFGGAALDVALATVLGATVGLSVAGLSRRPQMLKALGLLAAIGVAAIARAMATSGIAVDPAIVIVSALVVLLPGYSFTVGMVELGSGHHVSGASRAASAGISLMMLVLGVALGGGGAPIAGLVAGAPLPWWCEWVALAVAPIGFGVMLGARRGDLGWVMLAGWLGVAAARFGDAALAPPAGAFFGALALGLTGSLVTRWFDRPAVVLLVPGVLLLVPGSMGFRSLVALLGGDVLVGVDHAFHMALTASALAAGLMLAPALLIPRRPI